MRILVVDDDEDTRVLLQVQLEAQGHAVETAANGVEGLAGARRSRPDLIISDILMPEMDGFALCRAVKSDEELRNVPFIFYTATYVEPKDEKLGLAMGASRFVIEPVEPHDFLRIVDEVLREHWEKRLPIPDHLLGTQPDLDEMHATRLARKLDKKVRELERERGALQVSEARFRSLVQTAPSAIICLSAEGRILEFNPEAERIYGVRRDEVLGREGFQVLVADEAREAMIGDFQKVLAGEPSRGYECPVRGAGGADRVLLWNLDRLVDTKGRPTGVVLVGHDMTERKRAEEALRESEQRLELALRGADLGLWDWSVPTGEVVFDERSVAMLGYSREEIEPDIRWWVRRIHPEDWPRVKEAGVAHLDGRMPFYEGEYRLRARSGEWKWILARGKVVARDPDGQPLRMAGTHLDLTERKRIEAEREWLEEQLSRAQHLESIGRLTGGIAHDFNNLLTPIMVGAEMVLETLQSDDPLAEAPRHILQAARRASDLTRKFLAFSRKQVLETRVLDLNVVVTGFEELLRRLIREDIQIQLRLDRDLGAVRADQSQIEQIIMNLAINAADAMPDGGKLTIETANTFLEGGTAAADEETRPGPHVMLTVSDTGHGMDAETTRHIFEPFFTTKERGKGTGLGLATVYGIVKQHGGNIWVHSEPGRGTAFHVSLPRADEAPEQIGQRWTGPVGERGNETILVVEDQEMLRSLVCQVLAQQGYRVIESQTPADALRLAEENEGPVHVLLTDVIMPQMNARELHRQLASQHPEMKVLYMSGYTDETIAHHGILDSGIQFLQKPFSVQKLTQKVREVLDG